MIDVGFDLRFGLVWSHLGDVGQGIEYDRRKEKGERERKRETGPTREGVGRRRCVS